MLTDDDPYMLFPILVLIAFRFSPGFSAITLMLISLIALTTQILGGGLVPLGGDSPRERLIAVQAFWSVASIMILMLSAAFTERRQAVEDLQASERTLQLFVEYAPAAIAMFDRQMKYIAASSRYCADYHLKQQKVVGRSHYEIFPEMPERWKQIHQRCLAGEIEKAEEDPFPRADGTLDWVRWEIHPWHEKSGEIGGLILFSEVFTERKRAEEVLRESEASLRESQRVAHVGHWAWDPRQNKVVWSDEMKRIFGLDPETFDGDLTQIIAQAIHPDDREKVNVSNQLVLTANQPAPLEYRIILPDQSVHMILAIPGNTTVNEAGEVIKLTGIVQDITERKQAEEKIKTALAEKETLLRELYHRTKNNMQVISALLDLQAAEIGDERLQVAFRDTQNRIHAMALVHEKLYQARDLSQVNLKSYIEDLARLLFSTYQVTANQIKLVTELDEALVTIDTAIPCGLILNELISNALKYAFPTGRAGQIHIRLHKTTAQEIQLRVADDGAGVPPGFDFRRDGHLGLQNVFVIGERQLGGQVNFETELGVTCQVVFRSPAHKPRV